jgi:putative hemolysin
LLICNGAFAMAEIAIVSAKKTRLQSLTKAGNDGANLALNLAKNPERFLSTVQIGITLISILAGARGASTLAPKLAPLISSVPWQWLAKYAESIAFGLVVVLISYLSLVIGELVPKSLALRYPEKIACWMSAPLSWLSRAGKPVVWLLELSTRGIMSFFGKAETDNGPTRAEVEVLVREGLVMGSVRHAESEMVEGVFDLRELRAEEIMRPKPRVVFVHLDDTATSVAERMVDTRQLIFPVYDVTRDNVVGLVSLRELYLATAQGKNPKISELMHDPLFVSDNQPALTLLEELRNAPLYSAIVTDEFGIVRGLVTIEDLVEEVVGNLGGQLNQPGEAQIRQSGDDTWMVDGKAEIDLVVDAIPGLEDLVDAEEESFQTLAGLILHHLERLPREGESFKMGDFQFEVVDMDLQHVDKVSIRRMPPAETEADPTEVPAAEPEVKIEN